MIGPASSWLFHHAGRIDPTLAVVAIPLGWRLITGTWQGIEDTLKIRRWLKHRRSRPDLACRTPGRMIQRLSGRTSHHAQGPIMPSEDEIKRYGRPDYGAPYVEPSPARPGPVRTLPHRRGLVAGVVAFLAVLLVAGIAAGAYFLGQRSTASSTPTKAASAATTSAAPVKLDSYARLACQTLDKAVQERAQGDRLSKFNAGLDEYRATTDAAGSANPQLAAIAQQKTGSVAESDAVTQQLRDWCTQHWSPGQ